MLLTERSSERRRSVWIRALARLRLEPDRTRAVPAETDSPLLFRQLADL